MFKLCEQLTKLVLISTPKTILNCSIIKRFESNYKPNPNFENPAPYKERKGIRRFYENKLFTGGILPRPEGEWEDKPLPMPKYDMKSADAWTEKKALFGQNDYIDILGDGQIHPWELHVAPVWLKGYRGTEIQRLLRQMQSQGNYLKETYPTKYNQILKQIKYLYKKVNRRQKQYSGPRSYSRIDKPRKLY